MTDLLALNDFLYSSSDKLNKHSRRGHMCVKNHISMEKHKVEQSLNDPTFHATDFY